MMLAGSIISKDPMIGFPKSTESFSENKTFVLNYRFPHPLNTMRLNARPGSSLKPGEFKGKINPTAFGKKFSVVLARRGMSCYPAIDAFLRQQSSFREQDTCVSFRSK